MGGAGKAFGDVIKLKILRWDHPESSSGPKSKGKCPFKGHAEEADREGGNVEMEAGNGVTQLQAKEQN